MPTEPRELTAEIAERFARIALGHVGREYPNKPDHVLAGPQDARTPRELHPVFYGSFDWHSCVHSYWLLARVLRRFPETPAATEITPTATNRTIQPNERLRSEKTMPSKNESTPRRIPT